MALKQAEAPGANPNLQFFGGMDELTRHGATGLWTSLDIILMYLYPDKAPELLLQNELKAILVSPELFDCVHQRNLDGYHLERAVSLLAKHGMLEGQFVTSLVRRMLALTETDNMDVFFELDDSVRQILTTLIAHFPEEVWSEIASRLVAEGTESQFRLEGLISSSSDDNSAPGLFIVRASSEYIRRMGSRRAC
jgi:hypothetical protein